VIHYHIPISKFIWKMLNDTRYDRRKFLANMVRSVGATELSMLALANMAITNKDDKQFTNANRNEEYALGPIKQIDAGILNVGYAEVGTAADKAVVLLHGWPYDIHTYAEVAPMLASSGYRVIIPYLRGFGSTRFLSDNTLRNGQQSAIAHDIINLMDALKIQQAIVGGCDWGARTANTMAAIWPERVKAMVSVSGYLIGNQQLAKIPLPPAAELQWWYQYYFSTERGRAGYDKYRREFAKLIWQSASPKWNFEDAIFNRTASSFDNPDHVSIVIHNYRWRLGLADGESKYDDFEKRLAEAPVIKVPSVTLEGDANGAPHPSEGSYANKFSGRYIHHTIGGGIGHNLPQEAPKAFADAIVEADRFSV
jgi:pimeloyl-ACP methyl ester carboxylesterase